MLTGLVENCHFIFVVQEKHFKDYNLNELLTKHAPGCTIVQIDGITEGIYINGRLDYFIESNYINWAHCLGVFFILIFIHIFLLSRETYSF